MRTKSNLDNARRNKNDEYIDGTNILNVNKTKDIPYGYVS